jgi:hypothetical protein
MNVISNNHVWNGCRLWNEWNPNKGLRADVVWRCDDFTSRFGHGALPSRTNERDRVFQKPLRWHLGWHSNGEKMRKLIASVLWPIPALLFAPMIVLFAMGVRVKKK